MMINTHKQQNDATIEASTLSVGARSTGGQPRSFGDDVDTSNNLRKPPM